MATTPTWTCHHCEGRFDAQVERIYCVPPENPGGEWDSLCPACWKSAGDVVLSRGGLPAANVSQVAAVVAERAAVKRYRAKKATTRTYPFDPTHRCARCSVPMEGRAAKHCDLCSRLLYEEREKARKAHVHPPFDPTCELCRRLAYMARVVQATTPPPAAVPKGPPAAVPKGPPAAVPKGPPAATTPRGFTCKDCKREYTGLSEAAAGGYSPRDGAELVCQACAADAALDQLVHGELPVKVYWDAPHRRPDPEEPR